MQPINQIKPYCIITSVTNKSTYTYCNYCHAWDGHWLMHIAILFTKRAMLRSVLTKPFSQVVLSFVNVFNDGAEKGGRHFI